MNKLEKVMSWSVTSTAYSVTVTAKLYIVYIVYNGKQTLAVTFLGKSFSLYVKKLQNIIVLLYLSVFYMHISE